MHANQIAALPSASVHAIHWRECARDSVTARERLSERNRRERANLEPRIAGSGVIDLQVSLRGGPIECEITALGSVRPIQLLRRRLKRSDRNSRDWRRFKLSR